MDAPFKWVKQVPSHRPRVSFQSREYQQRQASAHPCAVLSCQNSISRFQRGVSFF
jgi:hypothetical protein